MWEPRLPSCCDVCSHIRAGLHSVFLEQNWSPWRLLLKAEGHLLLAICQLQSLLGVREHLPLVVKSLLCKQHLS